MAVLAGWIAIAGIVGVVVSLVLLVVQFIFKRGWIKKRILTVGAISLVLLITGVVMGVSSVPGGYVTKQQVEQNETVIDKAPAPEKNATPNREAETAKSTASENPSQEQQKQDLGAVEDRTTEDKTTDDLLKNIVVTVETQEMYDRGGNQKAVIWVENKTDYVFSGELTIMVRSGEFSRGMEIFTVTDLKPGTRTWGIMWLRTSFMGEDTGRGAEPKIVWSDVEFGPPQK